ncbi:heterokaryon incompatibility protein-domain-containing protein [Podospora australis]|uniref:Heterokaryon incompatibility protein-domain-containing protein n=1 Tax=Podospora australis TaxID=1536484 RepID=A0AAN7AES9_9PEZI|nr:heterokaryon incompatibility protein-domain-containing protein [Podospora australis]
MGRGLFLVPLPIAITLIFLTLCIIPGIPLTWPGVIVWRTYTGNRERKLIPDIITDVLKWIAYSLCTPCAVIAVLGTMCIAQTVLFPWWLYKELPLVVKNTVNLPRETHNLYLRLLSWRKHQQLHHEPRLLWDRHEEKQTNTRSGHFIFTPLRNPTTIRLLTMLPADDISAPLRGDLTDVDLYSHPKYDALSYTSADEIGDATKCRSISLSKRSINGQDLQFGNLAIGKNCDNALRRLRHPTRKRTVWVDAICINQTDLPEKSQQVVLMARIFTEARRVMVYTGEGTAQTDQLFNWVNDIDIVVGTGQLTNTHFLTDMLGTVLGWESHGKLGWLQDSVKDIAVQLDQYSQEYRRRVERLAKDLWTIYFHQEIPVRPAKPANLHGILSKYLSRRYFQRLWVIQEILLPDITKIRFLCGGKETTGERALHMFQMLDAYQDQDNKLNNACSLYLQLHQQRRICGNNTIRLLDLLVATRNLECDDPRDRIYALLGIARWLDDGGSNGEIGQEINYTHSAAQVYATYSARFIRQYGPGFLLGLIDRNHSVSSKIKGLPSWAADFSVPYWYDSSSTKMEGALWMSTAGQAVRSDKNIQFDSPDKDPTGQGRMAMRLQRPRIVRGWFSAPLSEDVQEVRQLPRDEVLVELHPGLAEVEYYTCVGICLHALTREGVEVLVRGQNRAGGLMTDDGGLERSSSPSSSPARGYLGKTRVWRVV